MWRTLTIVKSGECTSIHCTLLLDFLKYFHYKNKYNIQPLTLTYCHLLLHYIVIFLKLLSEIISFIGVLSASSQRRQLQAPHTQNVSEPYSLLYSQHSLKQWTLSASYIYCDCPNRWCVELVGILFLILFKEWAFPVAQTVKNLPAMRRPRFSPWVRKIPWRREW